jgi:DNA-binding MarR family transcriptional regulator
MATTQRAATRRDVEAATSLRVAIARLHRQLRLNATWDVTASQASTLARIEAGGRLRVGAVAELEGMSAATMSKIIDSLVERRLIKRVPDPQDGRVSLVQLSDEGGELLSELRTRGTQLLRQAIKQLNADDRTALGHAVPVLDRLGDLLQDATRPE